MFGSGQEEDGHKVVSEDRTGTLLSLVLEREVLEPSVRSQIAYFKCCCLPTFLKGEPEKKKEQKLTLLISGEFTERLETVIVSRYW